jgi:hypothetical protein
MNMTVNQGTRRLLLLSFLIFCVSGSGTAFAQRSAGCDRSCLSQVMDRFVEAMLAHTAQAVPLADTNEVRQNTAVMALGATAWKDVKTIRSRWVVSDPLTGNVVLRAGVELADGKPGYISTRLKVLEGGRIADVEISADTSPRVVGPYVWNLDPRLPDVLPPDQRMTRVALQALAARYFHSLSTHAAIAGDFDAGCDRFHSGQRITNVGANTVESGPARTCASSLEGNVPWGPNSEARFPVLDEERGIVFGVTLLHYLNGPAPRQMYVSEVFKVIGGRITRVDNIGLMMEGVATLGFTH